MLLVGLASLLMGQDEFPFELLPTIRGGNQTEAPPPTDGVTPPPTNGEVTPPPPPPPPPTTEPTFTNFKVYVVNPISNRKVLPTGTVTADATGSSLNVTLAQGEYESASFVVQATKTLSNFRPVISGLTGPGGARLPSSAVEIFQVKAWYQGCAGSIHYRYCPGGPTRVLVPELLLHDPALVRVDRSAKTNSLRVSVDGKTSYVNVSTTPGELKRFDDRNIPTGAIVRDAASLQPETIPANENRQYWVTVHAPTTAAAGTYTGAISFEGGGTSATARITVVVLPFTLSKPPLEYSLYYRGQIHPDAAKRPTSDFKTAATLKIEIEDMVAHGVVSCTNTETSWPPEEFTLNMSTRLKAGMLPTVYQLWAGSYFDNLSTAQTFINLARDIGYRDIYFYAGEEMSASEWSALLPKMSAMRKIGGKVFAGDFADMLKIGGPYVDQANITVRDTAIVNGFHTYGARVFLYGTPQVGVEEPETYRRNYGLTMLKLGFDGVMDYAYQDGWGSIWNDFDGYFRDHVFAYPTSDGVVGTTAWEGFREAVDDMRYYTTLQAYITKAKARGVSTSAAEKFLAGMNPQTGDLNQIRATMIQYILSLR
jgi:hypothetical protein